MRAVRDDAVALGDCFMAYRGDVEETADSFIAARIGAIRFAEFVNVMIGAHTKKKKG